MAQELKITSIVDQKVIDQVKALGEAFESAKEKYSALALKLADQVTIKVTGYTELKEKAKGGNAILKEISETQTKLAQIQKEYKDLLKQIADQTKENVKQILEEAKANKLNADAEVALQKAETERLKQQKLSNQESKKRNYTVKEGVSALKMEIKTMKDAETQNKILRSARKEVDITTEEGRKTVLRFNDVIERNDNLLKKNSDALIQAKMNVGRYKEDIKAATSEILKGNISLQNMGSIARNTGGLLKSSVGAGLTEVKIGIGSMIKGIVGAQAVIGGIQKLIGLLKSGVRSIIDFEAANSNLAAILGTTSNRIKDLTVDAQRLGATTKYTASQATALQIELAKLGFSKTEILQSTEYVLKFAQATGSELPEAAALAGAALRMFNADTSETERYVSAMAIATTKSALSFSYLQTAMPIVGPVAKAFNFQIEDTLALLGKLSDAGFDASMAATATRNIFLNLADSGGKLAKALGGPVNTLPELVAGLKRLKEQGVDLNATLELTDKRSVAAFNAFLTAADKIVPLREQVTGVNKELGDMADTMGDNVQGAIANLSSAWEALALSFSNSKGWMKSVIDWLAEKIRNIASSTEEIEDRLARIGNTSTKQGEDTYSTQRLRVRTDYNKRMKVLISAGDSEEIASTKALKELSSQRVDISEAELKHLEDLKNKAIQAGKDFESKKSWSWSKFLGYGTGSLNNTKEIDDAEQKMIEFQKKYQLFQYEISKKQAKNTAIDSIMKEIVESVKANEKSTQELTDEEKRKLEKAAKERLKLRETLQQLELELMDEGLKKELEKISLDYNRKIATIQGKSEEESKMRIRLAEKMEEELNKAKTSYVLDKEKKRISDNLELVEKGSEKEFELRKKQLELERELAINAAIDKNEDVFVVDEIYNKKFKDLQERNVQDRIKLLYKENEMQLSQLEINNQQRLNALEAAYKKGEINEEQYQQGLYNIQRDAAKLRLELMLAEARAELVAAQETLPEDEVKKIQLRIDNLRTQLETLSLSNPKNGEEVRQWKDNLVSALENMQSVADEYADGWGQILGVFNEALSKMTAKADDSTTSIAEMFKRMWKNITPKDIFNAFSSIAEGISGIMSNMYDSRMERIEEEREALQESHDKEIEQIENLKTLGAISAEEAEARKRAAEEQTARKEKELEKQKAQMQEKSSKWEKQNSIVQSIIATALGITKAFPNIALMVSIAAMGAAQTAIIAAQPIPKYAKGTDNHPGGLAIVGDGGKREGILTNKGLFATPSIPTLVDLPKGATVLPDLEQYISVRPLLRSDLGAMSQDAEREGIPLTVNITDTGILEVRKELRILTEEIRRGNKDRRKEAVQRELDYLHRTI